jgi:DNA-binding transcriptional LysR family regulator
VVAHSVQHVRESLPLILAKKMFVLNYNKWDLDCINIQVSDGMATNQVSKVDIHLLRVFCVVVDAKGFSNAQVVLNVSTSTISRQISQLELRLNMHLCERGRTGFRVTEKGATVYQAAQKLFNSLNEFQEKVDGSSRQLKGHLALGVIENWASNRNAPIVAALSRFTKTAPEVTIELHSLAPDDIEFAVLDGEVSLGVGVFHVPKPGLIYSDICEETIGLYCGAAHPLFDLEKEDDVSKALAASKFAKRAYLNEDVVSPETQALSSNATAHQMEAIALLILTNNYIGYLPSYFAKTWINEGRMKPVAGGAYSRPVTIKTATRRGQKLNLINRTFLNFLDTEAQKLTG